MSFNASLLLGQVIAPDTSFFEWTLAGLASVSSILMLLSALLIFVGACYLVATKRRPAVLGAYLVLLPLPVIISLCGWIKGSINSLIVIASTPESGIDERRYRGRSCSRLDARLRCVDGFCPHVLCPRLRFADSNPSTTNRFGSQRHKSRDNPCGTTHASAGYDGTAIGGYVNSIGEVTFERQRALGLENSPFGDFISDVVPPHSFLHDPYSSSNI